MAKRIINDRSIAAAKEPGRYRDVQQRGLYLNVSRGGAKSWVLRYMLHGKAREMGLGSIELVPLADARHRAYEARRLVRLDGIDPVEQRRSERTQRQVEEARRKTFATLAEDFIKSHREHWTAKTCKNWEFEIAAYATPKLGKSAVASIDKFLMRDVLAPVWDAGKHATARRLRVKLQAILRSAIAHQFHPGPNPADLDLLRELLPWLKQKGQAQNMPALPYQEVPALMKRLREHGTMLADGLMFTILTAARSEMTLGAKWGEVDLQEATWTVPAARMKTGKEHRVPLSKEALAILLRRKSARKSDFIFTREDGRRPAHDRMRFLLQRTMGHEGMSVHGFRSCLKTWCTDETSFGDEVSEFALAHVVGDETARTYNRGTAFKKRRQLMEAWSRYCSTPQQPRDEKVVSITAKRA